MPRFTVIDCEQRTPMWFAARAGRATASRAKDIRAKGRTKGEEATTRRNYRIQLAAEILTGSPQEDGFVSAAMQHGIDTEPRAIAAYEALTGELVRRCGFLQLDGWAAGCSLDGYLGDFETLLSVKCPQPAAHVNYWKAARLPPEYVPQATHELWVTGAKTYHFCCYNESFPEKLQLFLVSCDRSEFDIGTHEAETLQFLKEVDAEVAALKNARNPWLLNQLREAG